MARSKEGLEATASAIRTLSSSPPLPNYRADSRVIFLSAFAAATVATVIAATTVTGVVGDWMRRFLGEQSHLLLSRAAIGLAVLVIVVLVCRPKEVILTYVIYMRTKKSH